MILRTLTFLFLVLSMTINNSQAQYQKVTSHGLDIYYRVFGTGSPILIIGGGPGDVSDRVLGVAEGLAGSYQCILVDQRGTGKSSPAVYDSTTISVALTIDDFEAIRKQLGIKEWAVLGVSYGGFLSSMYAASYPASVSSLILVGTSGVNTDHQAYFGNNIVSRLLPSDIERAEYWGDSALMAQDQQKAITEQIRAIIPAYFFDRKKSLLVSEPMKPSDFNFEVGKWIEKDIENRKLDLLKTGPTFDKPVLILTGRQDPVGESVSQIVSHFYKNSKLVFIEKCGHYSWVEQPEIFFAAVKSFLPPGK
jgi:proline iminopeptidase